MKHIAALIFCVCLVAFAQAQGKPEGLFINSKAPEFSLKDQYGATVKLKDIKKKGPIVLLFYRGSWCPFCNRELKAFQDSLSLVLTKKAQLVAITPEGSAGIDSMVKKNSIVFPILSDEGGKTMEAYQVAFKVEDRTVAQYKKGGIDLLKVNNQKEAVLPVPAVYIINTEGTITYRYFDENYKRRVSVNEILKNIK